MTFAAPILCRIWSAGTDNRLRHLVRIAWMTPRWSLVARRMPPRWFTTVAVLAAMVAGGAPPADARTDSAYPRYEIKRMVIDEARRMRFPIALALAVAHAESNFDARARSHKGARGVMQIMPATSIGEYGIDPDLLWRPNINIRMGIHFLGRLIRRYGGRTDLALSYYNGGSAVGVPGRARVLPATYGYVRKVRALRRWYMRELYRGTLR